MFQNVINVVILASRIAVVRDRLDGKDIVAVVVKLRDGNFARYLRSIKFRRSR